MNTLHIPTLYVFYLYYVFYVDRLGLGWTSASPEVIVIEDEAEAPSASPEVIVLED